MFVKSTKRQSLAMNFSTRVKYKIYHLKTLLKEFIKYDYQALKFPLSLYLLCKFFILFMRGKELESIHVLSSLYRTGWWGSKNTTIYIVKKLYSSDSTFKLFTKKFLISLKEETAPLDNTQKFFDDPEVLFNGVFQILRSHTETQKGVILIKYSYYFPLYFKLFDAQAISENYYIVLEPSWAGTCEAGILAFATLETPVIVMAYEQRDFDFIKKINTNLIPIALSSNWWVDHRNFTFNDQKVKPVDIVIVSGWSEFKRHYFIFKQLAKLKKRMPNLKVSCIGYPGDLTMNDIKKIASDFELSQNIEFHEWLTPAEVSGKIQASKVNLLWSRFEGLNRSIIEGMFCNVPCILREGFNYGQKYPYINDKTGHWSAESQLNLKLEYMIENYDKFSPYEYVSQHHTCIKATEILENLINGLDSNLQDKGRLSVKINELHGMAYFIPDEEIQYKKDVENIMLFKQQQ